MVPSQQTKPLNVFQSMSRKKDSYCSGEEKSRNGIPVLNINGVEDKNIDSESYVDTMNSNGIQLCKYSCC